MIEITKELIDSFKTDSDVIEYAEKYDIPARELFMEIEQFKAKGTNCYGCKHILMGWGSYPCNCCTRQAKDMFEQR